jgi:hypothetical protein
MEKYEILMIVLGFCLTGVLFRITVEEIVVFKILKIKKARVFFNSKKSFKWLFKVKQVVVAYYNYQLPTLYK